MVIGILSDTHNMLRPEVKETLQGCDLVLHAGDIAKPEILQELRHIAPLKVVRGNNDRAFDEDIPKCLEFEIEGLRFFMTHKKSDIPESIMHPSVSTGFPQADIVIFGHSHKYEEFRVGPTYFLNPGSCGPRRFTQPITMAIMEIVDGVFSMRRVEFEHKKSQIKPLSVPDMNLVVIGAVRDIEKGLPISELARKYGISEELGEQICRMYLTHPGIDAQGILNKMELYGYGLYSSECIVKRARNFPAFDGPGSYDQSK